MRRGLLLLSIFLYRQVVILKTETEALVMRGKTGILFQIIQTGLFAEGRCVGVPCLWGFSPLDKYEDQDSG